MLMLPSAVATASVAHGAASRHFELIALDSLAVRASALASGSVILPLVVVSTLVFVIWYLSVLLLGRYVKAADPAFDEERGGKNFTKGFLGASLSCMLEFYDFSLYGFFATNIGSAYLPDTLSPFTRQMITFLIFWGSFVMRPVGGVIFGHIGDRLGRAVCVHWTVGMMMLATTAIGALPPYAWIGMGAPVLLVIARLSQGVAVGGQLTGSLLLVLERVPENHRCFTVGIISAMMQGGICLGSAVGTIFKDTSIAGGWYWRIPFVAAVPVGILTLWLLWDAEEADELYAAKEADTGEEVQALEGAVRKHWPAIIRIALVGAMWQAPVYIGFVYMPIYLSEVAEKPTPDAYYVNTMGLAMMGLCAMLWGHLGDYFGRYYLWIFVVGCSALACAAPVAFWCFEQGSRNMSLLGYLIYSVPISTIAGLMFRWYFEQVPDVLCRYSAISIAYNITVAVFAGSAPNVAILLTREHGLSMLWPYVSFLCVLGVSVTVWDTVVNGYRSGKEMSPPDAQVPL